MNELTRKSSDSVENNLEKPENLFKNYRETLDEQLKNWQPDLGDTFLNRALKGGIGLEIEKLKLEAEKLANSASSSEKSSLSKIFQSKNKEKNQQKLVELVKNLKKENTPNKMAKKCKTFFDQELRDDYERIVWLKEQLEQYQKRSTDLQYQVQELVNDDKLFVPFMKAFRQDSSTRAEGQKALKNIFEQGKSLEEKIELEKHITFDLAMDKAKEEFEQLEFLFHRHLDPFSPEDRRECFKLEQKAAKAWSDDAMSLSLGGDSSYWRKQRDCLRAFKKILIRTLDIPDVNSFTSSEELRQKLAENQDSSSNSALATENTEIFRGSPNSLENEPQRLQIEQTYYAVVRQQSYNQQSLNKLELLLEDIGLSKFQVLTFGTQLKKNKEHLVSAKKSYGKIFPNLEKSSNKLSSGEQEAEKQLKWLLTESQKMKKTLDAQLKCIAEPIRQFLTNEQNIEKAQKEGIDPLSDYDGEGKNSKYRQDSFSTLCKYILCSSEDTTESQKSLKKILETQQYILKIIKNKELQKSKQELKEKRNQSLNSLKRAKNIFPEWLSELVLPQQWLTDRSSEVGMGLNLMENGLNEDLRQQGKEQAETAISQLESKKTELIEITNRFLEIQNDEEYKQFIFLNNEMTNQNNWDNTIEPENQIHFTTELGEVREQWRLALTGTDEGNRRDALARAKERSAQLKITWDQRAHTEPPPAYSL